MSEQKQDLKSRVAKLVLKDKYRSDDNTGMKTATEIIKEIKEALIFGSFVNVPEIVDSNGNPKPLVRYEELLHLLGLEDK